MPNNPVMDNPASELAGPAPRIRGWRKWTLRLAMLVAGPTLFLMLAESSLWLVGYGRPSTYLVRCREPDIFQRNDRFTLQFAPQSIAPTGDRVVIPARKDPATFRVFILGESAAMGTPDGSYSFGRMLESMLRLRHPAQTIEVHTAAITAINSHVLLPMARECARREPDLFILYIGNNESIGPFGPATVFRSFSPSLWLIRAGIFVRSTRTGQLLGNWVVRRDADPAWRGMETFAAGTLPPWDPRRDAMYSHYERNMRDIIGACRDSGAKVVVCTIGVNKATCPPFASMHGPNLSAESLRAFDELIALGDKSADPAAALEAYQKAVALDDRHAAVRYRLGIRLAESGKLDESLAHLQAAVDLDALQFRTDSRQNEILRRLARESQSALVDIDARLNQTAGRRDDTIFWEHVHFRPEGNWLVARLLLDEVEKALGDSPAGDIPTFQEVARDLALTPFDQLRLANLMVQMMSRAPFVGQLGHAQRSARLRDELSRMQPAVEDSLATYEAAVAARPGDWRLRLNHGAILQETGRLEEAKAEFTKARSIAGDDADFRMMLAHIAAMKGDDACVAELTQLARLQPSSPAPHRSLAVYHLAKGDGRRAADEYARAIELQPDNAELHANLAAVLLGQGDIEGGRKHAERAVALADDPQSHGMLSSILRQEGKLPQAIEHLRLAIRREPTNPKWRNNLAGCLLMMRQVDDAIVELKKALELDPRHGRARWQFGQALMLKGQLPEALAQMRSSLDQGADTPANLTLVAWLLATHPSAAVREGYPAVVYAEKACRLTEYADYNSMEALAAAYAEMRQFDKAVSTIRRAIDLATAAKAPSEQIRRMQFGLERYSQSRQIYQ